MDEMQTTEIDGNNFSDFDGFIAEFNKTYMSHLNVQWTGNLDSFNDFLYHPPSQPHTIRWIHSEKSRKDLGHSAMAAWYQRKNSVDPEMQEEMKKAQKGEGETLFELLVDIITKNKETVSLSLE